MPYKDAWKRQAARRAQYWRKKQERPGYAPMWQPVDMLLAMWCVQLRHRIAGLESMWRVVAPIFTYPILRGTGRVSDQAVCVMGTRIILRLDGRDCRVCELEGENVLADLVREQDDFHWVLSRTVMRAKEATHASHKGA